MPITRMPSHHESPVKDTDKLHHMTHHRVNDSIVWLNGSRAIAEVMAFPDFRTKMGTEWVDLQCWARFHYRAEKRNGRWGIVYFEGTSAKAACAITMTGRTPTVPKESKSFMRKAPAGWVWNYEKAGIGEDAGFLWESTEINILHILLKLWNILFVKNSVEYGQEMNLL